MLEKDFFVKSLDCGKYIYFMKWMCEMDRTEFKQLLDLVNNFKYYRRNETRLNRKDDKV